MIHSANSLRISEVVFGTQVALMPNVDALHKEGRTVRMEKDSRSGMTRIRLIGRFQSEHVEELKRLVQENGPDIALDLQEVTLVDVEVVRFLRACERDGVTIVRCPRYVREWIFRECEA